MTTLTVARVPAAHGAKRCGLLGDATVHPPGSMSAIQRSQEELAKMGITTAIKPIAGVNIVEFLRDKGIEVGQPAPQRVMPVCGLKWAEAGHEIFFSSRNPEPFNSVSIFSFRWLSKSILC